MLITENYRAQQKALHGNPVYGAASRKFAGRIAELIDQRRPRSILDYGAGKCALRESLGPLSAGLVEYDPAVEGIDAEPVGAFDLVCCVDVLEHIEPDCLDDVLAHIRRLTAGVAFLTIHTGPAGKFLPDGRNAHLIQKPKAWWAEKLSAYFPDMEIKAVNETTLCAICEAAE